MIDRRSFIVTAGAVLAGCATRRSTPFASAAPPLPTSALSLQRLQTGLARGAAREARILAGLNRFEGFLLEGEDVIVFGRHEPTDPTVEIEDLVVALRNAYGMPGYEGAIGCTIDPLPGAADPWLLQVAKIFGMPPTAAMGVRHLAVDYELKKVSAGLVKLANVRSTFETGMTGGHHCQGETAKPTSSVHRFWFTPLYSKDGTRFLQDARGIGIRHPVGVQLMSEEEFLNDGRRVGGAPPRPEAMGFCASITRVLAGNDSVSHARMRQDFRVIELARLFVYKQVDPGRFRYLLDTFPLSRKEAPARIPGVRRDEVGTIHCGLTTSATGNEDASFGTESRVERFRHEYRGGVEASISVAPLDFVTGEAYLDAVRQLARRCQNDQFAWALA